MSAAEDVEAINDYMHDPANGPRTKEAEAALNAWVKWYEDTRPSALGWWSSADYDHARNLRNEYNRKNAVTSAQKAQVEQVIKTGQSTEQAQGETDRRDAGGNIVEQPPGVTHSWWFWPALAAGAAVTLVTAGPKLVSLYLGKKL